MTTPKVSAKDKKDFAACEKKIDQWLDQSVEAGNALVEIKKRKLYLISNPDATFESYVKERFGKTRQWAYDLINKVMVLAETGFDLPTSVAQPLKGLDSKTKQTVTKKAAANAKKEGRDLVKRTDIEAAIKSTPAARKQKAKTARGSFRVVAPNAPQPLHRLTIASLHRGEVAEVAKEFGDDVKVTVPQNVKEPIEVECYSVSALARYVCKIFDNLPIGSRYEFSVIGEIVEEKQKRNRKSA